MGRNAGYFFHEGLRNLRSHRLSTFTAVSITVACLLIMGTFSLVAVNANANLHDYESASEIVAFVRDGFPEGEEPLLQDHLTDLPNVTAVRFITREEALAAFREEHPDEELFQDLDPAIFRDRFAIRITDLTAINETAEQIRALEGIDGVNYYEEVAGGFISVRNVASVVCVALIGVLFVVSVFIMSNTIRLTTFDRREEIAVMRIVGATNSFIRWPFVYEGLLMGVMGAGIAFVLQWALYTVVAAAIAGNDNLRLFRVVSFVALWWKVGGAFLISGMIIGVGGSLSAIRKFLRF